MQYVRTTVFSMNLHTVNMYSYIFSDPFYDSALPSETFFSKFCQFSSTDLLAPYTVYYNRYF